MLNFHRALGALLKSSSKTSAQKWSLTSVTPYASQSLRWSP